MFLNFLLVETDQPGDGSSSSSSTHTTHSVSNGNGSTGGGNGGAVPYFSVKDAAELGQALRK